MALTDNPVTGRTEGDSGRNAGFVPDQFEAGRSGTSPGRAKVPAHLRRYVVEQAYEAYADVDQAVWRFVLTQIYDTLRHTAHPAYEKGLERSGIRVDRIPSIAEMDRRLSEHGWSAVCVDGFIPPRAFVEFQALGILPIAAEMRTKNHLVYTPAPDIIHEAAGHAPIIPDQAYAAFLRRIGQVGSAAFSSPEDDAVYQAIHALSEIKERPDATEAQVAKAAARFERASASVTRTTEAARMSRLYWWTAEYGLVGTPRDYRLYGAGLLSSLGESHSCHGPSVQKIPLSLDCLDVAYDITRAQPQLFVARDFDHLNEVVLQAAASLASWRGGSVALNEAARSGDVSTIRISDGLPTEGPTLAHPDRPRARVGDWEVIGTVTDVELLAPDEVSIRLRPGWAVRAPGSSERLLRHDAPGQVVVLGPKSAAYRSPDAASRPLEPGIDVTLQTTAGRLEGRSAPFLRPPTATPEVAVLTDTRWGSTFFTGTTVVLAGHVTSAAAGASAPEFFTASEFPTQRVPSERTYEPREARLNELFTAAAACAGEPLPAESEELLERIHAELEHDYPDEWLLRWNLLEAALRDPDADRELIERLVSELRTLEERFEQREPIAMGLGFLQRVHTAQFPE